MTAPGKRLWIYPADVLGKWRSRRSVVSGVLLCVFLVLPWLRIRGHQALLLDVWNGKFSIFGLQFWSHDAPLLFLVAASAILGLALVTSLWGRVWCGWACPQTVFVDLVFRRVERWLEGNSVERRKLDLAPWSLPKVFKKTVKWTLYLALSLLLSHSFLAYFIGTQALSAMTTQAPSQNLGTFIAMAVMTLVVLFDFGWFREQFCILICPYGRFQSVLMDASSLAVTYDVSRGEPRRGAELSTGKLGDCIDCKKCVQVCPTGIDIRNGLQLECIACTACIDACDSVMTKIKKPIGLIRYDSVISGSMRYARAGAYSALLLTFLASLAWLVSHRKPLDITLLRSVGAPYDEIPGLSTERSILNRFRLDLRNQSFETLSISLDAESADSAPRLITPALPLDLPAGSARTVDLVIQFPFQSLQKGRSRVPLKIRFQSLAQGIVQTDSQEVPLVGPLR